MTATLTQTQTILTVDGLRSPMLHAGPAEATEAVVFVHGNPGSSQDWARLVERTGTFARAVAWDHPGFGQADKPAGFDYTVHGYATHLGRCLEVLGITRAHLVLHDFGGPWGLAWAAAHPDAFASATLLNIGVLPGYRWHYLARIWRTPLLGELFNATTTRTGFRLLLRHGNPRGLPRPFVDRMYADLDRGTKRAILALYRATDDPAGDSLRLGAALRPLDRPTLVIWGRHDPYLPVALAERQREAFPSARVEILDSSGHWPFMDDPERTERLVLEFLGEVVGDRPLREDARVSGEARERQEAAIPTSSPAPTRPAARGQDRGPRESLQIDWAGCVLTALSVDRRMRIFRTSLRLRRLPGGPRLRWRTVHVRRCPQRSGVR
jgi:pimeloyl-ACP methyl ester carboxylesterase